MTETTAPLTSLYAGVIVPLVLALFFEVFELLEVILVCASLLFKLALFI